MQQENKDTASVRSGPLQYTPSFSQVCDETILSALQGMSPADLSDPKCVTGTLLAELESRINVENAYRQGLTKWKVPQELGSAEIATVINYTETCRSVMTGGKNSDPDYDLLAVYQKDGPDYGIYSTSEDDFKKLMLKYNYHLTTKDQKEVMARLKLIVDRVSPNREQNLIAVNNGIFDFDTKTLRPFSEDMVFLSKSRVDYNPGASNVTIHNDDDGTDWDVESWMDELSDDPELVELLWQTLGAIIRPNVPWNKSVWFYSETGNNGKGTLCELMRQLCGEGSYAAIPLSDMGKEFALEPVTRASAIIVDENDVGTYIDKAANLKALITGDVMQINRKFKTPIAFQFHGFMVQCLNEMPKIKDKSDSFYRRQLFIPFEKCFTGVERKYIKHDYLHRQDVLEYVLYKVLNMDYYELSDPKSCRKALEEYKEFNDPIRQFISDIVPDLQWDMVPYAFLYDLYCAWYRRNMGSGMPQGRNTFINDFSYTVHTEHPEWIPSKPGKQWKTGTKMSKPEPFIEMYDLKHWKGSTSSMDTWERRCTPSKVNDHYAGIQRVVPRSE